MISKDFLKDRIKTYHSKGLKALPARVNIGDDGKNKPFFGKGKGWKEEISVLYEQYSKWSQDNGHKRISKVTLGRRLTNRGFIIYGLVLAN
ncbi:MAG: hypothetical protein GY853_00850 [PVC group bacterium]|nr:hypothetical protein [PVC group bacterium]